MLLLEHTPRFPLADASTLAMKMYGLRATATALPSERDQNFLLKSETGEKFILKIANSLEARSFLEAQNEALAHVARALSLCPEVIPTINEEEISQTIGPSGTQHFVRLLTYLPGTPLGRAAEHSPNLLRDLGRRVAQLDQALATFDHPAIHRNFHWDLAKGPRVLREHVALVEDQELRALIEGFAAGFERDVIPLLPALRQSAIHNDANDYNVLVDDHDDPQRVVGLIDFGDMVHSYTVGDLAVAIAYAILDKPDPLKAAAAVVEGYTAVLPMNDAEVNSLFGLVCLRLCMSVCHAAQQQRQRPGDEYLSISQRSIRRLLPRLAAIKPAELVSSFGFRVSS